MILVSLYIKDFMNIWLLNSFSLSRHTAIHLHSQTTRGHSVKTSAPDTADGTISVWFPLF